MSVVEEAQMQIGELVDKDVLHPRQANELERQRDLRKQGVLELRGAARLAGVNISVTAQGTTIIDQLQLLTSQQSARLELIMRENADELVQPSSA